MAERANPKRDAWWWIAAILTPIGVLGGPIAGADLAAGIIEWRGPIPYILAFWQAHISAPIGTILEFLASSLAFPTPPELLADYLTLSLLFAGSFIRVRRLMHPTESLEEARAILHEGIEPPMRRIPGTETLHFKLPPDIRSHGQGRPDVVVLGTALDSIMIGTRAAGAYDQISRSFKPLSKRAFASLIIASVVAWPVALVAQLYLLHKDLRGWAALRWSMPRVAPSGAARRAAYSGDQRLVDFTREQLVQRAMRFTLALSPFLLFLALCMLNLIFFGSRASSAERVLSTGALYSVIAIALGATFWAACLVIVRRSGSEAARRALERADARLRDR